MPPERIKIQSIKVEHNEVEAKELKRSRAAELHAEPHAEPEGSVENKSVKVTRNESIKPERDEGEEAKPVELENLPTLPEWVKELNRKDVLFAEIREYLASPMDHD